MPRDKKKRKQRKVLPGTSARGLRTGFPRLGDIRVPEKGLQDPALRRDIGDVPGLSPTR